MPESAEVRADNAFLSLTQGFGQMGLDRSLDWVVRNSGGRLQFRQEELDILYELNNFAANIIEYLPEAMGQKPPVFSCEDGDRAADMQEKINSVIPRFVEATKLARQCGGSGIFIGARDGFEDLAAPINLLSLREVSFLSVVEGGLQSGWTQRLQITDIDKNPLSPGYGKPLFYKMGSVAVHASRVIPFYGIKPLTRRQQIRFKHWGLPVLTRAFSAIRNLDVLDQSIATTVTQFSRLVMEIPDLNLKLETKQGQQLLKDYLDMVNYSWNVLKTLVIQAGTVSVPGGKVYNLKTDYTGLDGIITHFKQQLAGAADIPYAKLFNVSQGGAGLGGDKASSTSTDRQSERQWADQVIRCQNNQWLEGLNYLIKLWSLSKDEPFGGRELPGAKLEFQSILQLTEAEEAAIAKLKSETAKNYSDIQAVTPDEVAESLAKDIPLGSAIDLAGRTTPPPAPADGSDRQYVEPETPLLNFQ